MIHGFRHSSQAVCVEPVLRVFLTGSSARSVRVCLCFVCVRVCVVGDGEICCWVHGCVCSIHEWIGTRDTGGVNKNE